MLKEVTFPKHRRYKSRTEWEPVGFFSDCLCNSTQFDLMLGFFSSSAINVLADGFATFLYNGGRMRLIINDILTEQDKNAIANGNHNDVPYFDIADLEKLKLTLSERNVHFFECLSWLVKNDRLDVKIVAPKEGIGIAHTKTGVFCDGVDYVAFDGSCNFSRTALVDNIESLTVSCEWDGNIESEKAKDIKKDFELVFDGKDDTIVYKTTSEVRTKLSDSFKDKSLTSLLEDEYKLVEQHIGNQGLPATVKQALEKAKLKVSAAIKKLKKEVSEEDNSDIVFKEIEPSFPYSTGPRDYQKQAFENWKNNKIKKQQGLFAMATGTGKTITSLNCLLEIYKKEKCYKAIILVPTITLVEQWEIECKKFNFNSIIKVCSKYTAWKSEVSNLRMREMMDSNNTLSYIIISTYASFVRSNVFVELNQFPRNKLLLIADEAHNMGGGLMSKRLSEIKYWRRIGLSATPERQFDEQGNRLLMDFFSCGDKYTFEYTMAEAIENGALCRYYYYPHVVKLTDEEMTEYVSLSKLIVKIMGFQDSDSQERLKMLLLKRKRIIHKAANKLEVFKQIIQQRLSDKGNLKYSLVYVPEGNKPDSYESDIYDQSDTITTDPESEHLIDNFTSIVRDMDNHIIVRQFTSESKDRDIMLRDFAEGNIDVLTSMKCLDEGVDVPRSEFAVFCSSTGNPRQFIQRRGRVLRTHADKQFAIIHDLVVIPDNVFDEECYTLEKNLVQGELRRVRNFALIAENLNDTDNELQEVLNHYNLSIFNLQ